MSGLAVQTSPEADALNPNLFYAYNPAGGSLFASTDGGASFSTRARLSRGRRGRRASRRVSLR